MIDKHIIRHTIFLLVFLTSFVQNISVFGQEASSKINYDAAIALAQELAIDGNYEVARLLCQRVLTDIPEYFDAYFILGNTYAWDNQPEQARLFYNKVFEYNNGSIDAFKQLITMELWDGDADEALDLANMALKYHPGNADVLMKKAKAQIMLGDFFSAKKSLFLILSEDSYNYTALELYRDIIKGVPKEITIKDRTVLTVFSVDTIFKKAQGYAWNQDFIKARETIDIIIEAQPDYLPAQVLLAQTYAWQNEYAHAREIITVVNLKDRLYREGIITAVDIELWNKDYAKAIENIDSLGLKYYPGDRDFLFKKAEIYEAEGDLYRAKDIMYQMLRTNPKDYGAAQYYNELRSESLKDRKNFWANLQADSREQGMESEAWLIEAREYAYNQQYEKSRAICNRILEVYPENYEAQFLTGMTFAWEGRFDEARFWYNNLMATTFDSYELIGAIVDLETWDHNYTTALERVNYGLRIYLNDKEYLLKKVTICQRSGELELANRTLDQLISAYPDDKDIRKSYYNLKGLIRLNAVGAGYTINTYALPARRTWQMYSGSYYHTNDVGTFVGSVNTGYISTDTSAFSVRGGYQFEIDAYPIFTAKKRYYHFNFGYSPSLIFAKYRFGAHIYQDLIPTWELSAGFDYSYYKNATDTANVLIFQAGINKYWTNFMASFILTMAPTPLKLAQGYTLIGRKYLGRPDNWIQLAVSAGVYPENPAFYLNDITITPVGLLNSYTIYAGARYLLHERWIGQLYVGYQRQEYMANLLRNAWTANISVIYLLNKAD
ncbi:MAG: YaiO family outer membrane beta-barrel protein [Bacteroidales bacterium]|nr:YaiO family outer membrane beta-barrel protein [Bacteroidales bacterium]